MKFDIDDKFWWIRNDGVFCKNKIESIRVNPNINEAKYFAQGIFGSFTEGYIHKTLQDARAYKNKK